MDSFYNKRTRICPKCGDETKRIEMELESHDLANVYVGGWLALLSPNKDRALVCEHCGSIYQRLLAQSSLSRRVTLTLVLISAILGLIGLIVVAVAGLMNR